MPGRELGRRPPTGKSDQLTRGLRLWRRDGSFRPVLGFDDVEAALAARPDALLGVGPDVWDALQRAWKEGLQRDVFLASLMNGRAFLTADDAESEGIREGLDARR